MERTRGARSEIGMMYQYAVTAYFAGQLSADKLVEDYIIYSSVRSAGKFDDIVAKIRLKDSDDWHLTLIQVKYKHHKKLNVSDALRGKSIEYNLSEFISSFSEIIDNVTLPCRQGILSDNIRFCIFSNASIQEPVFFRNQCTFQLNLRRHYNSDPITKILLPFGDKCYTFQCRDLQASNYRNFLDGCYLYLEEANYSQIHKCIQYSCGIDNANDIVNYVKDYFNNHFLYRQGLHKQVFEIELHKIRLSNFVLPLTQLSNLVDDDRVAVWNEITLNQDITIANRADHTDIEGCLYGCIAQRISSLLEIDIHWNEIVSEHGDLSSDVVDRFIHYSKTKTLRYWIYPPNTLKSLILELWKLGSLTLILKTDTKLSYFEKYMYLKRSYVILSNVEIPFNEISQSELKIFSHLGNINNPELRDRILQSTAISLQGRKETTLKNLLGNDVQLLSTFSPVDVIGLMKKRFAYLKDDCLSNGSYLAFLIENREPSGNECFTEPVVIGDNIKVECQRDDIEQWARIIKENPLYQNYIIYRLRRIGQYLELIEGDKKKLTNYFVDQFGDLVCNSKENVPIPVIGEPTPPTEINYVRRYLRWATISDTYFASKTKALFLLSGDLENLASRIKFTKVKDIGDAEQNMAEEESHFIKVGASDRQDCWNRFSTLDCAVFDINVKNRKLEIRKYKQCSNLNSYISYDGGRLSEGEFFNEITDNAVTVVTGDPGMGKSSLLKSLCNVCDIDGYVLFYDLIHLQNVLNRTGNLLAANPIECIFGEVHPPNLKYAHFLRVLRQKKVILVLDSFDEIISSCEIQVLEFIKSIVNAGIQVVIASRLNECSLLMSEFNALVVKLDPLSSQDDKEYSAKWKLKQNILENVPSEFTTNPLYLNFLQVISESGESLEKFTRFELYEKVINMKINRRLGAMTYKSALKDVMSQFERLALVVMFGKEKIEDELKWEYSTESFDCMKFGIVTDFKDDYPIFDHFTFVEFLVAQWLVRARQTRIYKTAARNIYKQLMDVRKLDTLNILSEHLDLQKAILHKHISTIKKTCEEMPNSLKQIDKLGRNALHVATICCREVGVFGSSYEILDTIIEFMRRCGFNMDERDAVMEWEWTDYVESDFLDIWLLFSHDISIEQYLNQETSKIAEHKRASRIFPIEGFDKVLRRATDRLYIKGICNLLLLQNYENEEFYNLYKACSELTLGFKITRQIETDVGGRLSSLHIACIYGGEKVLRYLIESAADVNIKDKFGCTPLHYNFMRYSLDKKCIEVKNKAMAEARGRNQAITKLLLEKGADVNIPDAFSRTPLDIAIKQESRDIFNLLLETDSKKHLQTALVEAVEKKQKYSINKLLDLGVNPQHNDAYGKCPFHVAVSSQDEDLVYLFLKREIDVNLQNVEGETVLHEAVCNGDKDIVKVLLKSGANVNLQNVNGETALHKGVGEGRIDVIRMLLEHGADVNIQDENGHTPLDIAANIKDVAKLLLDGRTRTNF